MVQAILMIDTAAGQSEPVAAAVRDVEEVQEVHVVAGDFDVAVELEGNEVYDVLHAVTSDIRSIEGVGTTRTYVCLD
jgi:DNA-binding Lrp family transcriptional regulator